VAAGVPLLSFVLSLLFATVVNYADERMAASRIRDALGRHTMPGLVEALLRRPHHLRRAGDRQVLTTLVCRLDGFAQAMDSTKPKDLVRVLDEMLSDVSEAVTAHGGHIDRVVGATVVAYWGAPLPNERHALDGCRCALRLKDKLATRVAPWKERLGSEVVARISVCTGEMVVGNLSGARGRQRFAVFGPVMEAAERLVEQTVQLSTSLLIGEATFEAVKDEVGARELDLVRLPGRAYPLRLFELRSLTADQA
jgi:adenylate cyclase